MKVLQLRNREKSCQINLRLLRGIIAHFLTGLLELSEYEIAIHFVSPEEITILNETFLRHAGSTDVITFEYPSAHSGISGEIFVCVAEAVRQAPRFHQSWQSELLRYAVHGVLHLQGYKDDSSDSKRVMRRMENKWLGILCKQYDLKELASFKDGRGNLA